MSSEPNPTVVSTSELRAALDNLFALIEQELGTKIELSADHYWHVGSGDAFDLGGEPSLLVGQLSDDLESVRSMTGPLWHDLDHMIGILRRLAALSRPDPV